MTEDENGHFIAVDYYTIYRHTDPNFSPNPSDSIGYTTETFYDDPTPALQNPDINHYYLVKAVDCAGRKSEESNRVGEFDRSLINGE